MYAAIGISITGGSGTDRGDLAIFIRQVHENGLAHRDGRLKKGDMVLSVNGVSLLVLFYSRLALEFVFASRPFPLPIYTCTYFSPIRLRESPIYISPLFPSFASSISHL